jgi:hypothetical protein
MAEVEEGGSIPGNIPLKSLKKNTQTKLTFLHLSLETLTYLTLILTAS